MSLAVQSVPTLCGILIAFIGPGSGDVDPAKLYHVSGTQERKEVCTLLYPRDEFGLFQERAALPQGMEVWENDDHYMVRALQSLSWTILYIDTFVCPAPERLWPWYVCYKSPA